MNPIRLTKHWISYHRTMTALRRLSNDRLEDIGLTRYDIRSIAERNAR